MAGIDNTLSSLARKLEPYIIAAVRRVIGNSGASADALADTGYTTIMSRKFLKDSPDGAHGGAAADFGSVWNGSTYESGARATGSTVLASFNSIVYSGANYGVVGGYYCHITGTGSENIAIGHTCHADNSWGGAMVIGAGGHQSNNYCITIGNSSLDNGDVQASTYSVGGGEPLAMSNAWQAIEHVYGVSGLEVGGALWEYQAWTFSILLTGAEYQLGKIYSYKIDGVVKKATTTPAIVMSVVTTLYTDDQNFGVRVNSAGGLFTIEVIDSGNSGRYVKWSARCDTAEVAFESTYP